jgi:predicted  nucleic acid-binding Zn-ribbon protein
MKNMSNDISFYSLPQACAKLHERLEDSLTKNFDIFELYIRRNIFTLPRATDQESSASASQPAASSQKSYSKQLEELDKEIGTIKARYLETHHRHRSLLNECGDNDRLLKDMRSALFHLRVGAQVLDENNLQPLEETVRSIVEQKEHLTALTARAEELNNDIRARLQLDNRSGTYVVEAPWKSSSQLIVELVSRLSIESLR